MPKFRKKPVVIEAFQFDRSKLTVGEAKDHGVCYGPSTGCVVFTDYHLHTIHTGQIVLLEDGDWVLPEPDGKHFYPCKPDIFAATYESVDDATPTASVVGVDDGERGAMIETINGLECERDNLLQVARMALQQFEFTYGKRKRGWDAKYLMERLQTTIANPECAETDVARGEQVQEK